MEFSSIAKLRRIAQNLTLKMKLKVKVSKFFFAYLANYLLLRPAMAPFSEACVSLFEDIVTDSIANISQANQTDCEFLLFVLVICQEMFMFQFFTGQKIFSPKFLKFFRKLNFLYHKSIWRELLAVLKGQTLEKEAMFHFFDPHAPNANDHYNKRLLDSEDCLLLFLMQTAFFLLQQPHNLILNNFIFVNQETLHYPISKLMNLSTFMEKSISSVYQTNRHAPPPPTDGPPLVFVLSRALRFLGLSDRRVLCELVLLNRASSRLFKKLLYNKILSEQQPISRETRMRLFQKLIILDAENFYGSIAQSMYVTQEQGSCQDIPTIVKMDVERTKFFSGDAEQLRMLLQNVGEYIPSVGYYQGLNCLGAFMLDYFEDFAFSFDVISFCLHKYMKKYFFGDFRKLNKLVFVGETLIQEFYPEVYSAIEESGIGHGYYLSSVILTIFFSSLQFCRCGPLILLALDLYAAEGWVGFYKVV